MWDSILSTITEATSCRQLSNCLGLTGLPCARLELATLIRSVSLVPGREGWECAKAHEEDKSAALPRAFLCASVPAQLMPSLSSHLMLPLPLPETAASLLGSASLQRLPSCMQSGQLPHPQVMIRFCRARHRLVAAFRFLPSAGS